MKYKGISRATDEEAIEIRKCLDLLKDCFAMNEIHPHIAATAMTIILKKVFDQNGVTEQEFFNMYKLINLNEIYEE